MRLTGSEKLDNLCRKYSEAKPAIERWVDIISSAQWKNHAELKNDFSIEQILLATTDMCSILKETNTDW